MLTAENLGLKSELFTELLRLARYYELKVSRAERAESPVTVSTLDRDWLTKLVDLSDLSMPDNGDRLRVGNVLMRECVITRETPSRTVVTPGIAGFYRQCDPAIGGMRYTYAFCCCSPVRAISQVPLLECFMHSRLTGVMS